MSFHKVYIKKKFKFKKNITVNIKPKKGTNEHNSNINIDDISNNHYITLLFSYNNSMTRFHKMHWKDTNTIYLNMTKLYLKNNVKIPCINIDSSLLKPGFKYKKYIRKYIDSTYGIRKKEILTIKLLETFGNLHNYLIILKNIECLDKGISSLNTIKPYSWRTILDFYNILLENSKPSQSQIYEFISKYKGTYTFTLKIDVNNTNIDNTDEFYIKNYNYDYSRLIKTLSTLDFKY